MTISTENHLAGETAAYLVQHTGDPTGWWPWGPAAFDRAKSLDRPVFLSLGYASCHWCHVMQRESFRDPEAASFLNERFVPVKVDREQRPDVDHLYQQYVTLAAGSSGWPLSAFLTPGLAPFYGGTYFPKRGSYAMQSFAAVLTGVDRTWREERAQAEEAARNAMDLLADLQAPKSAAPLGPDDLEALAKGVVELEDAEHGGLGDAPKWPQWPLLEYLLAHHEATGHPPALETAERWLYAVLRGGLYDHVGGGVFRYATDAAWTLPHFEKMLPDNGMLLSVIARMHRLAPSEELAHAARGTAAFLARDLARPGGGFWSSLDAETGGVEGASYLWSPEDLAGALSPEERALTEEHLGVGRERRTGGRHHLTRREGRARAAEAVDTMLAKLLAVRQRRTQPRAIENAPADWNAVAARGLIEAGAALGDDGLLRQGLAVLDGLVAEAVRPGRVMHLLDGAGAQPPLLADHAHLAAACLAAHAVEGDGRHSETAGRLLSEALELFENAGLLHMTAADTDLPLRPVAYDDEPVPSGMSTLLEVYRALRPEDEAGFRLLFAPLRAFARHSPLAAGRALAVASAAGGA